MNSLKQNAAHIVVVLAVIGAVAALAALGTIPGAEALAVISAVAGVSVGGSVASASAGASNVAGPMVPPSAWTSTPAPLSTGTLNRPVESTA